MGILLKSRDVTTPPLRAHLSPLESSSFVYFVGLERRAVPQPGVGLRHWWILMLASSFSSPKGLFEEPQAFSVEDAGYPSPTVIHAPCAPL